MIDVFHYLRDRISGKAPKGKRRDKSWRRIRKEHLIRQPRCMICGTTDTLEVHHILPYHLFPDREKDPENLLTLCDGGGKWGVKSCHRFFGHLGRWRAFNPNIVEDARIWRTRLNGGRELE